MEKIEKLNELIDKVFENLREIKINLNNLSQDNNNKVEAQSVSATENTYDINDFESLKKALESDKWPEAVNPNLICDPSNEQDKLERGRGIVELMIEPDLKGLKMLDFGCGEGHVAYVATEYEPSLVVGYDCVENEKWSGFQKSNLLYTKDWNEALKSGPFDVIVLFDVIDHAKSEDGVSILRKVRQALTDDGQVFMRCHPYISRHGTHLYHHLNKAYAHLVFTKEELNTIAPDQKFVEESTGVLFPLKTYDTFAKQANLEIVHRREITSKVDSFFKIPKIAERIIKNHQLDSFPEFQMSLDFVDYVLKKSN